MCFALVEQTVINKISLCKTIHSGPEQNQDFFLCPIKRPLAPFNIGPPESKMTKI